MSETNKPETAVNLPAAIDPAANVPAELNGDASWFGSAGWRPITNFPQDPRKRFALEGLARESDAIDISSLVGQEIAVEWIYLHPVERDGEAGEMDQWVRTVLIDPDGTVYQSSSQGVAEMAYAAMRTFRGEKFTPPLRFKIRQVKTARGFQRHGLQPIVD